MSILRILGWAFGSAPETVASRNCGIVAISPISAWFKGELALIRHPNVQLAVFKKKLFA